MSLEKTKKENVCILVVGMHRSGTSLVASILQEMGVNFGTKLIPAANDNPKGFFEDSDIVAFNKHLLKSYDVDVDGIDTILPDTWQSDANLIKLKKELTDIIENKSKQASLFGIKDPRISLLLPLYVEVLSELKISVCVVHVKRNIIEIARSLQARNNISLTHALQRIQDYNRQIDLYAQDNNVVTISYNQLIENPNKEITFFHNTLQTLLLLSDMEVSKVTSRIDKRLYNQKNDPIDFLKNIISENEKLQQENETLADKMTTRQKEVEDFIHEVPGSFSRFVDEIKENLHGEQWWQERIGKLTTLLEEKERAFNEVSEEKVKIQKSLQFSKKEIETIQKDTNQKIDKLTNKLADTENHNQYQKEQFQSELEELQAENKSEVEKLQKEINHQENILTEQKAELQHLHTAITNIERSFTWKSIKAWDMLLRKIFSKNSKVLHLYYSGIHKLQDFINGTLPHLTFKTVKKHVANKEDAEVFWKKFKEEHGTVDVLFVSHDLTRTGAPRIVFDVAQSYGEVTDKNIAMACIDKGTMFDEFTDAFGTLIVPGDLYPSLTEEEQISKILDQVQPKVVYVNSQSAYQYAKQAKAKDIPVIFHIHELEIAMRFFFSDKQLKEFKNYADTYIAVSQPVYDFLVHTLGCDPDSVVLQHAFIDSKRVKEMSDEIEERLVTKELDLDGDEVVIGTIGMFIYRKGADIFMRMAKKIHEKTNKKCVFLWIGSRPFKEPFMEDFAKYKEHFTILGEKKNPFPYLKQVDIFVLPSREDPFPLVTLEAMVLDKPSVIFDEAGGIKHAVKDAGLHVASGFDEDAFTEHVISLIEDEKARKELAAKAAQNQKPFDSSTALPRIHQLINKYLGAEE